MPFISKMRDFFRLPKDELPPEREDEIIEDLAKRISKYDMEDPAGLYLSGFLPVSRIFSETIILPLAPFLELIGIKGYEYTVFFSKKENVRRLLNRILESKKGKKRGFWG